MCKIIAMSLVVHPVRSEVKIDGFDLFESFILALERSHVTLENGDAIIISSKFVANSQGRLVDYDKVVPSEQSKSIAQKFHINPKVAEIIIRESDTVFGGVPGFVITSADKIMVPNAGIDKSNAQKGKIILYPIDAYLIAEQLRRKIFLKFFIHVGIIIIDSRLMPARIGTIGVAIACAGIEPISDVRGQKDLFGNPLKVTYQAVADNLASIANLKMGEGSEAIPFVVIKNSEVQLTDRKISCDEMAIAHDQCVYVRGLRTKN